MKVTELITRLQEVPQEWDVYGTSTGSIEAIEPGKPGEGRKGKRYCYVFPDGRPTRYYTARR